LTFARGALRFADVAADTRPDKEANPMTKRITVSVYQDIVERVRHVIDVPDDFDTTDHDAIADAIQDSDGLKISEEVREESYEVDSIDPVSVPTAGPLTDADAPCDVCGYGHGADTHNVTAHEEAGRPLTDADRAQATDASERG
jgi:hypothetical protein